MIYLVNGRTGVCVILELIKCLLLSNRLLLSLPTAKRLQLQSVAQVIDMHKMCCTEAINNILNYNRYEFQPGERKKCRVLRDESEQFRAIGTCNAFYFIWANNFNELSPLINRAAAASTAIIHDIFSNLFSEILKFKSKSCFTHTQCALRTHSRSRANEVW